MNATAFSRDRVANAIGRNKLGFRVNGHERPLVSKPLPIIAPLEVRLLLAHVGPDFVALNAAAVEVAHLVVGKRYAAVPDLDQKPHDRVPVGIGHALG